MRGISIECMNIHKIRLQNSCYEKFAMNKCGLYWVRSTSPWRNCLEIYFRHIKIKFQNLFTQMLIASYAIRLQLYKLVHTLCITYLHLYRIWPEPVSFRGRKQPWFSDWTAAVVRLTAMPLSLLCCRSRCKTPWFGRLISSRSWPDTIARLPWISPHIFHLTMPHTRKFHKL